ncbi:MAG TPA: bifunctional proline dehydrogenase/L-glutamate gamma-semialdehyde dehydrogenase PutA [Micropepsaceae bacterium]|nr:bifunctional proline dehydrogenase/L-glutamate gamma-semialdehyde dehydrogenase PutA [Micropepsaceae bacterium]
MCSSAEHYALHGGYAMLHAMTQDLRQPISAAWLADEDALLEELIQKAQLTPAEHSATAFLARELITQLRSARHRRTGVDAFTQEYALSSEEGVVLMCLAESLLRVPDAETQDRLIRDKISGRAWDRHLGQSDSTFVNASTWALMLTGEVVSAAESSRWDFGAIWRRVVARMGEPMIRQAVIAAVRLLGRHFVLGRTIEEAIAEARRSTQSGYRFSFDMLGEAAVTRADAARYLERYRAAVRAVAASWPSRSGSVLERPGISVKLTAVHPRFEYTRHRRVMFELIPALATLCHEAREAHLAVTLDAEESERLDLTLDVFETLGEEKTLRGWDGLGIAVQAYQKRALPVIAWLAELAQKQRRIIPVRLVKGAYWDSEIKHGQELGLSDYPVFTRKLATDTSYIACTRALIAAHPRLFPQFATHNAQTLAAVQAIAHSSRAFEFQRLHGMGEALYEFYEDFTRSRRPGTPVRIYAPVGSHEDLLAYLIRRLLENGANTSFVHRLANENSPVDRLIADPVDRLKAMHPKRNPNIPRPEEIWPDRRGAAGVLLADPVAANRLISKMRNALEAGPISAAPVIGGSQRVRESHDCLDPADRRRRIGSSADAGEDDVKDALALAATAYKGWDEQGGAGRAEILDRAADLFAQNRPLLLALLVREAGRTVQNAINEWRETVDFLRYYAQQARQLFAAPEPLPGVTGERNQLALHGRGVFACIAPWNFPLSIFTGQIAGALAAGNAVLAKPAEQTPLIAASAVRLLHEAGVPGDVLHFLPGDGARIGKALLPDLRLDGVVFTGSTETAGIINRLLAAREGPIPVLIAETGGQNAMIVDSTALPEQVARDVLVSAFDSAGQRCSSLRVLFLQEDVADRMLDKILGATDELQLGDPLELTTDIGPVIDEDARSRLADHAERMQREATLLKRLDVDPGLSSGVFFPPHIFAIPSMAVLTREVFGPILHVVRFQAGRLDEVCEQINAANYGLTLSIHSRIDATADFVRERVRAGNIYVNRNQIGAMVGAQPFGGERLSGTGPKAGGPHYLPRFAVERTYTVNTAATGGDTTLLSLEESELASDEEREARSEKFT